MSDSTTPLDQIDRQAASSDVTANELVDALSPASAFGRHGSACIGLTWAYYGCRYGGSVVANGTLALTASSTCYIVADRSTGAVSFLTATTDWSDTSANARLYKVTTGASAVTAWEDHRMGAGGLFGSGVASGLADGDYGDVVVSGGGAAMNIDSAVLSSFGRTLIDDTDASAARTTLGVDAAIAAAVAGLSWKQAVRAATTVAGTLATSFENGDVIDGVTLATGDRILVKNQSAAAENGIYTVAASGAPARATDADSGAELVNASVYISEGTTLADTQWTCTTNAPITVGVTSLTFVQLQTGGSGTVTSVDASGGVETASGSAITSTGTVRGAHKINAQTGTSYAIVGGDRGKHLTLSNTAAIAGTIAQAGTTGFEDGYFVFIENIGAGAFTLTPSSSTVNGAATLVLASGMAAVLFSDGTNYRAIVLDRAGSTVNLQTGTSYTYVSGDRGKLVSHSNAAAIAGSLPQAAGAFGAGFFMWVQNRGAGTLTITPTTSTIDAASTLALTAGQGVLIASDGTDYYTMRGVGSGGGGLTNWTDSLSTTSPNATVYAAALTATGSATNIDAVISPKGTGALQSVVADNAGGGNKRGTYAVDWQRYRPASANRVASGDFSVVGGGQDNRAAGTSAVVSGGNNNSASGQESGALSGNGNTSSSAYSVVCGGFSNSALATYAAVLGGQGGSATGQHSAILGGDSGTASGARSAVVTGLSSRADADGSATIGDYSITNGVIGSLAIASGRFSATGDAQRTDLVMRGNTTDATPKVLTTNNSAAAANNQLALQNSSAVVVKGSVVARENATGDSKAWEFTAHIRRGANAAATAMVATCTPTVVANDAGASAWALSVTADTTNGGLAVTFTGDVAKTIRAVCMINSVAVVG
jgi:hypothetical protein